jgi:hypothetical protein
MDISVSTAAGHGSVFGYQQNKRGPFSLELTEHPAKKYQKTIPGG